MMTKEEFSTRMSFQYSILLDLISKSDFESFKEYVCSYEFYVKSWTSKRIKEHFSSKSTIHDLEDKHLKFCIDHINAAIKKAQRENTDSLRTFVVKICTELGDKLAISQDPLDAIMVLNNVDQEQFVHWLNKCVQEMTESLREKFKNTEFETKLSLLHIKPENELFNTVIGCGQQCPFCKIPCDAGGEAHTQHFAALHRPQGLGQFSWENSNKLSTDICSCLVISDGYFRCSDTKNEYHPYKRYREIYPDWNIFPDGSLDASDYWKYVMNKYNEKFAKANDAKPADIPDSWKKITKEEAVKSLKKSFNIK
ncbi:interferon-induced very large GTPase 1-like [Gambusia affinis]|nr:interferon-induced very large GTPase 1-like [Gambusia affinis]